MTIKQIDALIEEGESLYRIAGAYSEIANLKIKRIRARAERNRAFLKEISAVYSLVKKLALKKSIVTQKPQKTVSIVLTSNDRFYGAINAALLDFFTGETQNFQTDRIILGKAAVEYFRLKPYFKNYRELLLQTDEPTAAELNSLVNLLTPYQEVLVFYSGFKSLLLQQPASVSINAQSEAEAGQVPDFKFIFEPELPKILDFFNNQIMTLLLEGIFLESELSRSASRFISMDSAQTEANKYLGQYRKLKSYVKRNMDNNTILENFASMFAMRKELLK